MPKRKGKRGRPSTRETRLNECSRGHHRYAWKDRRRRNQYPTCLDCGKQVMRRRRGRRSYMDVGPERDTLKLNPRVKRVSAIAPKRKSV